MAWGILASLSRRFQWVLKSNSTSLTIVSNLIKLQILCVTCYYFCVYILTLKLKPFTHFYSEKQSLPHKSDIMCTRNQECRLGSEQHCVTMKPTSCPGRIPWKRVQLAWFPMLFLESWRSVCTCVYLWMWWRFTLVEVSQLMCRTDVAFSAAKNMPRNLGILEVWSFTQD